MTAAADLRTAPTGADRVEALRASWREVSRSYAAYLAAMVEVGLAEAVTPGWESAEIGAALTFTGRRAEYEYTFAHTLVLRLPLVFAALEAGEIDHHKARVFADQLADLEDHQIHRICTRILPSAHGWTTGQLAARLLREVHAVDRHFTRRRYQRAVLERGVSGWLAPDGTATITARGLTPTEAAAAADRLDHLAAAVRRAGHPGSIHQIRADLFVRLLDGRYNGFTAHQMVTAMMNDTAGAHQWVDNGPAPDDPSASAETGDPTDGDGSGGSGSGGSGEGASEQPGCGPAIRAECARPGIEVRIGLATLLGLDDHPAELPGWGPVLAEDARLLVSRQHHAEWIFAITDSDGYLIHGGLVGKRPSTATTGHCRGGSVEIHIPVALLAELADRDDLAAGWAETIADIADRHATWLARSGDRDACLDDHPGSRFARVGLRRHVRLRDRTCVAPGCRRPARKADQDHTRSRATGGRTVRANLGPLCERHHLMKHEGGWHLDQPEPGRFVWHSPLGQIHRTRGDPIAPDLPDPVPRNTDDAPDDSGCGGRSYDGPIFRHGRRQPRKPAAPRAGPDPVDLDDTAPS